MVISWLVPFSIFFVLLHLIKLRQRYENCHTDKDYAGTFFGLPCWLIFKLIGSISMSNLEQISDTLRNQLEDAAKKIDSLKKLKGDERFQSANKHQRQLNRIKNLLQTYDFAIKDSNDDDLGTHESQYKEMNNKFNKLEKELDYNRNQKMAQEDLFKHRNNKGNGMESGEPNKQQMIQKGHELQEEGMQGLNRIRKNVYEMENMTKNINQELDRQINQLDSIYDDMKDMDTTMKRAETHLRYFARQIYTDRLMICLIVVIVLAIIAIIILKIIGKTPQASIDQIK